MLLGLRKGRDVNPIEAYTYFCLDQLLPETPTECIAVSSETALNPCRTCT